MSAQVLHGKVAIITGGAGLLGRAFAAAIVERGGAVVIADIDLQNAERVADELRLAHADRVIAAPLDITSVASIDTLLVLAERRFGRIDGVVNNAYPRNASYGRKVEDVTYADFCENVDTHLGGYFLIMQRFARFFRTHGVEGSIVNMASIYGVVAPRFEMYNGTEMTMPVEYAAVKSGVIHLSRYFAKYYRRDGIRVNSVSPGGILDTQPQSFVDRYAEHCGRKGMLSPGDIVGALAFLLSDDARYVTGQNIVIDDGFTL